MGYARKSLISLGDTPYYHVVARCVRRAWLWGLDQYAGKDYSHRKAWVLYRLETLSSAFAIDVCAYAVMSNHYHLVLHVNRGRAVSWTPEEVIARWSTLFAVPALVQRWREGRSNGVEREAAIVLIERWRARLTDISWYMRCLNEYLARRANAEDECTGRFWEGRFKSQALLDEAGLLTAMAYVDLNPVRAGVARTPEQSEFTSIYARIQELRADVSRIAMGSTPGRSTGVPLLAFRDAVAGPAHALPIHLLEYIDLLDWTGRVARPDRAGAVDPHAPLIFERLGIDRGAWIATMRPAGNGFGRAIGKLSRLRHHAETLGQRWIKGLREAQRLYLAT